MAKINDVSSVPSVKGIFLISMLPKMAVCVLFLTIIKLMSLISLFVNFWLYSYLVIGLLCKFATIGLKPQNFYLYFFALFTLYFSFLILTKML